MAIHPDARIHVHAIEAKRVALIGLRGEAKGLSVPSNPARQETRAAGEFLVERLLDAPIMGQVQAPPVAVVERDGLSIGNVTKIELPIVIEQRLLATEANAGDAQ